MSAPKEFSKSITDEIRKKQEWEPLCKAINEKFMEYGLSRIAVYLNSGQSLEEGKNFIEIVSSDIPINTRRTPSGSLKIDTEYGCRLVYTQQFNGGIQCQLVGLDKEVYISWVYCGPSSIGSNLLNMHFGAYVATLFCTSKRLNPSWKHRVFFNFIKALRILTIPTVLKLIGDFMSFLLKISGVSLKP